jgi:hypothetical protein
MTWGPIDNTAVPAFAPGAHDGEHPDREMGEYALRFLLSQRSIIRRPYP